MNNITKTAFSVISLVALFLIIHSDVASQIDLTEIEKSNASKTDSTLQKSNLKTKDENKRIDIRNSSANNKNKIKQDIPEKKTSKGAKEVKGPSHTETISTVPRKHHLIVINPGDEMANSSMIGWGGLFRRMNIYNWGRSKQLLLLDDRKPVRDNIASFISDYGSRITIKGLMRGRSYSVWIDFVRFHYYDASRFPSRLKIFLVKRNRKHLLLEEINYSEVVSSKGLYRISIPYTETIDESIDLLFREYAPHKGFWGFWDMIVSDMSEIPAQLSLKNQK